MFFPMKNQHFPSSLMITVIFILAPLVIAPYTMTLLVIYAILGLSLGLIWGFGGILCFGQAAFFGLGAYSFAVAGINTGDAWAALFFSMFIPLIFTVILGAMLFYARLVDVYLAVVTLVVSLLLFKFMNATAGSQWIIGTARLGGFNGIPSFPTLYFPFSPEDYLYDFRLYVLVCLFALGALIFCQFILSSSFGRIIFATKSSELRMQLLGFDTRLYKLGIFCIGGVLAGLSGGLYANFAELVTPTLFGLGQSAEVIIWVIVGGVGTLLGPMIGAILLGLLKFLLGYQSIIDNSLFMGLMLIIVVLMAPGGLLPLIFARLSSANFIPRRWRSNNRRTLNNDCSTSSRKDNTSE